MITWNDLSADEQEAMKAVAAQEPNTFFTPAIKSLAQKGLIGLMTTANKPYMLTVEGGKVYAGRVLLPANGEAAKAIPPHATLLQDLQSIAMGEIEDYPVANIAMSALNLIKLLESEHAAALARAQAAEAEVARLREEMENDKPSYGYTVSIVLPDGSPDTMKSKGVDDHDALAYARLILERNYKDYPVKIVGISRVIV